ncbi:MAG: cation:proton antiporter [Candidatus Sulfotelmatobacter sp.]
MNLLTLTVQMALILAACRVVGSIFLKIGQPRVNGEMVAGILLGPSLLARLAPHASAYLFPSSGLEFLNALGQVGVILYMFIVGLTIDAEKQLKGQGKAAIVGSLVSVAAPMLLAFGLASYLYPRIAHGSVSFTNFALFLGAATSITAFPMLARIIAERNMMTTQLGAVSITCAATSGIAAWCILAYIVAMIKATGGTRTVWLTFAGIIIWAVIMFVAVKPVVSVFDRAFQKTGSLSDSLFAGMVLLMLVAGICSGYLGLHPLFGAFLLGVIMPKDNRFTRYVIDRFEAVTLTILLPLYFAFSGLRTNIGAVQGSDMWIMCLVITLVAIAGKVLFPMLAAWSTGMPLRESAGLGILLNTRGLIALIVFNIGLDMKVITAPVFSMLVVMVLVNTLLTLPMLNLVCPKKMFEKIPAGGAQQESPVVAVA